MNEIFAEVPAVSECAKNSSTGSSPASSTPSSPTSSPTATRKPLQILSVRRHRIISKMLKDVTLKNHPKELVDAIANADSRLTQTDIRNIVSVCPTEQELGVACAYNEKSPEKVRLSEQFVLYASKNPCFRLQVDLCGFHEDLKGQEGKVAKFRDLAKEACGEALNGQCLKSLLHTCLTFVNFLNQDSTKGTCVGFQLFSLGSLFDMKSSAKVGGLNISVSKLIADKLGEKGIDCLRKELEALSTIAHTGQKIEETEKDIKLIAHRAEVLKERLENADEKTVRIFGNIPQAAITKCESMLAVMKEMKGEEEKVKNYFHHGPDTSTNAMLETFQSINGVLARLDEFCRIFAKDRKERERLRRSHDEKIV